jgi:hypothetical protein
VEQAEACSTQSPPGLGGKCWCDIRAGKFARRLDLFLCAPLQDAEFVENLHAKFAPRSVNTSIKNALETFKTEQTETYSTGCGFIAPPEKYIEAKTKPTIPKSAD